MFETLLFDLDGTLTDPFEGITNSVVHALGKFGIAVEDRRTLTKLPLAGCPARSTMLSGCENVFIRRAVER